MIETQIEKTIKQYVFSRGGFIQKTQSGSLMKSYRTKTGVQKSHRINLADQGTPDMMGVLNGIFLGIEVKKDKKEVERWLAYPLGLRGTPVERKERIEAQKHFAELIQKNDGFFACVYSLDDLEDRMLRFGVI